jgi:outer membrane protein OmpA-like peptidoglycan-associated protein
MDAHSRLRFGTTFFAATEAGVKWRLYNRLAVYTGFWLDWGLNDISTSRVSDDDFTWTPTQGHSGDDLTPKADLVFRSRTKGRAIPASMGFTVRFALGAGDRYAVPDSVKWIRQIHSRDSLLALCNARTQELEDSLAIARQVSETLLDSLVECHRGCMQELKNRDDMRRLADSAAASRLQSELLAAREKARLDSLARAAQLERERAARLADFRKKLEALANGLDNYKVTQTVPSDQAREKLDIATALMRDYPDLKIRLTGHTCDRGTHEANVRFGMQRAMSAKNYLISKGIDQSRLEVASKAELEPLVPNTSEDNRSRNRRVQIEILEGAELLEKESK